MSQENILGTLVIVVLKGQHLIDNHTFYKQDPYAKLTLSGATKQTPVDPKGGQHPVWDAELRFPISKDPSKNNRTLTISVFSEEKKDDSFLGEGTVDITNTLKTGEFDDWVPLSLKGTQRGEVYLEMTFFAAGPAPLIRRPSKFTNPAERLARPQQPLAQQRQRVASQSSPSSSFLSPHGQASQNGPPLGYAKVPQVPLPGPWPGRSGQQQQQQPSQQHAMPRRSSKAADAPLPPLPEEVGPKEDFLPSILRPGGPPRNAMPPLHETRHGPSDTPVQQQYSARTSPSPIAVGDMAGVTGHQYVTNSRPTAHSYPSRQDTPPLPGSFPTQPNLASQPQGASQPHAPRQSSPSTQGTPGHVGYSTRPSPPQPQPELPHAQRHSPLQPPQQQHVQQGPIQQTQPSGSQDPYHVSSYPPSSHSSAPSQLSAASPSSGPVPPNQSHHTYPSPPPPAQSYITSQGSSPHPQSHTYQNTPPPAHPYTASQGSSPHAQPHTTYQRPPSPAHSHVASQGSFAQSHIGSPGHVVSPPHLHSPNLVSSPPPNAASPTPPHFVPPPPMPPPPHYAGPAIRPHTTPPSPPPHAWNHVPPIQSPAQPTTPPSYMPSVHSTFSPPMSATSSYSPSYPSSSPPAFPMPSMPAPQANVDYFRTDTAMRFPHRDEDGPSLPDPYIQRRYQTALPLPPDVSQPSTSVPAAKPMAMPAPTAAVKRSPRRNQDDDEWAARELQRREEEAARALREQEERDAELARTLDMELNFDRDEQERARGSPHYPPRHAEMVGDNMPGGW